MAPINPVRFYLQILLKSLFVAHSLLHFSHFPFPSEAKQSEDLIARVNRQAKGWIGYFHYANSGEVFSKMQWQIRARIRRWLWKKHGRTQAQYGESYSNERLHNHYGLVNFPMYTKW